MSVANLLGVGLRQPHLQEVLSKPIPIGWFEIHSENFFYPGVREKSGIEVIAKNYPISVHGIGLSLGSNDGVRDEHLAKLKELTDILQPFLISEHLSWNYINGHNMPDLLPAPYTREMLDIFCVNIEKTQDYLRRQILIENPSSYLEYKSSTYTETEFLVKIAQKTGAKILLDINNIYVSCKNHNWDPVQYINSIPKNLVYEFHLAGHTKQDDLLIDTHSTYVCQEVWGLYAIAIERFGRQFTLIEWDLKLPSLDILLKEAYKCEKYLCNKVAYA